MTGEWTFAGEPSVESLPDGSTTLVEGASFSICGPNGDIEPRGTHGLFFRDTRFVSTWKIGLDGAPAERLATIPRHPFAATFVSRGRPGQGESDSTLFVERTRYVGNGMREDLTIRNFARAETTCALSFSLDADFAHVFEVKDGRVRPRVNRAIGVEDEMMSFSWEGGGVSRQLAVEFPAGTRLEPGFASLDVCVPAFGEWRACLEFRIAVDGEEVELRYSGGEPVENSSPVARLREWEQSRPVIRSDLASLNATFRRSRQDIGALRIFDAEAPDEAVVAAGAPWYMTLFGRDSLITSVMTLMLDPSIASSTLTTLARMQGERVDDDTEEQPGKILHEVRQALAAVTEPGIRSVYYGSVDATPLFVVVLGELFRWGADEEVITGLLPHADRALAWIDEFGDRDGDGFVEYGRATNRGLVNQGWKDSFDGVSFSDGRLAEAPIALCEVQGYVYAAYRARAEIARHLGDARLAGELEARAGRLKAAFNERFWLPDSGCFALGLDAEKRPIDAMTSNVGHCLWSGIVDDDKAALTAERLCGPEMFTGWGIRTLASSMARYNPVSYHNGSVWPHDSSICAAGLARYGFVDEANAVTRGLFEAAEAFGGRLPELFCGFDRAAFPVPVSYPSGCSPQAWASASPFWLLRTTLLGLEVSVHEGVVRCSPSLPDDVGTLTVENVVLAGRAATIEAKGSTARLDGLPGV